MTIIEEKLNSAEAKNVFRKHHIIATGIAGVRRGYELKGDQFMIDLLRAIGPPSSVLNLNGNYGDDEEANNSWLDDLTSEQQAEQVADTGKAGKGWDFWAKALSMVGSTGVTIGKFKNDLAGNGTSDQPGTGEWAAKNNSTILYVVAAVIVVIVLVLIFKNKLA